MNYAKVIVLILLASALVIPVSGQPIFLINYGWGSANQQIRARPGYSNVPFTVEVLKIPGVSFLYGALNLQGVPIESAAGGTFAYAAPESAQSALSLSNSTILPGISIPTVSAGSSATLLTFYLSIPPYTRPGSYSTMLTVFYKQSGITSAFSTSITLTVSPPEKPRLVDARWVVGNSSSLPYPGSGFQDLQMYLENPSSVPLLDVQLKFSLPRGVLGLNQANTTTLELPYVQPRGAARIDLPLNVTSLARPGDQDFSVNVSFEDYYGGHYSNETHLSLKIYPRPSVELVASQGKAYVGSTVSLYLTLTVNSTSPVYDVQVQPQFQPLELIMGDLNPISFVGGGKSITLSYSFYVPPNVPPGVYPVMFTVYYSDPTPSTSRCTTYVTVAQPLQNITLAVTPNYVYYSRNNTVAVTLTNSGPPIRDVQLSMQPIEGIYVAQGNGPWDLGDLKAGQSVRLKLNVIPSITQSGPVPLQFLVTYTSSLNYTREAQLTFPVFLKGLILIQLISISVPTYAFNGTNVTISGMLLNEGTAGAYYVEVGISPYNWSQEEYIGSLPTDSPTPFSLTLSLPNSAHGNYRLYINVSYQDSLGNRYSASYPLSLQVYTEAVKSQKPRNEVMTYGLAAIVLVGALMAYFVLKHKRQKK